MSAQEARDRLAALLPGFHVSAAETRGITGEHPVQFIRALFGIDQAAALADRLAEGDEALAALRELVRLKDGSRDHEYEAMKPRAWADARRIVNGGSHAD